MNSKKSALGSGWLAGICAAGVLLALVPGARTQPPPSNDVAQQFIARTGDDALKFFADSIEESYPFGRSNKAHDAEIAKGGGMETITTDWKVFNKHYLFDGDWFAVEWFYSATTVKTGGKQLESTLAFGKVQDGKLVVWDEYFDDVVGELEQDGKLPLYDLDEMPFPWPAKAVLKHPYRP